MIVASREAGGRWASARWAASRSAKPAGSQRTSACRAGWSGAPTATTRPPGSHEPGRVEPPPQRLLLRAQVGAAEREPGVEQHDGGVARAPATGSAPGVATTIAGVVGDAGADAGRRSRSAPGTPGKVRPSSSAVRDSPTTGARIPRWPHSPHAQPGAAVSAPTAGGRIGRDRRAGADRCSARSGPECGTARRPGSARSRSGGSAPGPVPRPGRRGSRRTPRAGGGRRARAPRTRRR